MGKNTTVSPHIQGFHIVLRITCHVSGSFHGKENVFTKQGGHECVQ